MKSKQTPQKRQFGFVVVLEGYTYQWSGFLTLWAGPMAVLRNPDSVFGIKPRLDMCKANTLTPTQFNLSDPLKRQL